MRRGHGEHRKAVNVRRIDILEEKIQVAKDEEAGRLGSARTRRLNDMKGPCQKEMDTLRWEYPNQVLPDSEA